MLEDRNQALRRIPLKFRKAPAEWIGFVPFLKSRAWGCFCLVERGTATHVQVDPIEFFARLLAFRPRGFALFHNHPSGGLEPSREDLDLTEQAADISERLGLDFWGHAVVTRQDSRWITQTGEGMTSSWTLPEHLGTELSGNGNKTI